eukprot:1151913-Pelagomonas_calceolata.AAC.15
MRSLGHGNPARVPQSPPTKRSHIMPNDLPLPRLSATGTPSFCSLENVTPPCHACLQHVQVVHISACSLENVTPATCHACLQMSEYTDRASLARLLGAPPGYVGYGKASGTLVDAVRRRPHCVLVLEDVDRAHPEVSTGVWYWCARCRRRATAWGVDAEGSGQGACGGKRVCVCVIRSIGAAATGCRRGRPLLCMGVLEMALELALDSQGAG